MLIETKILPFDLDILPPSAYLVGGAVRDALLGRHRDYFDLDFVLPQGAIKIARRLAGIYQAGFVMLDKERQIARVVFKQGTVDIAQQEGETLEKDLHRRDFTINAIAYNLHSQQIIDPLNGQADLVQGVLRMIAPGNLQDDPLRLMRAYRQGAQLKFTIEPQTRSTICQLAPQIATVAAERVQAELNYLLSTTGGSQWLTKAWEDGVLSMWLEDLNKENLDTLNQVETVAELMAKNWSDFDQYLQGCISKSSLSWLNLAKLSCIVSSNRDMAQAQLSHLKYSRGEIKTVGLAVQYLPRLLSLPTDYLSLREQYFLFRDVGKSFGTLIVFLLAKIIVKEGELKAQWINLVNPLISRYLDKEDQVANPTPLLTGNDLMRSLNLSPSPQVGKILMEIQIARIEGKVVTHDDALKLATKLIENHHDYC